MLALALAWYLAERRRSPADRRGVPSARDPVALALALAATALGALLFAGSLAAGDHLAWPGLPVGALLALVGLVAIGRLLARVGWRLEPGAAALLPLWADAAALVLAGVAILFPPAALVGLAALAYLLVAGRRAGERKYEGLRILR